jgi:hypothetical protein
MSQIGVGKEILSHCNKCKLTLAHIIVTMKSVTEADKVMCKTCKGTHTFKDPSAPKKAATTKSVIARAAAARSGGKAKKSTQSVEELWTQAMNRTSKHSVEYSIKGDFKAGDLIAHPNFGPGIVERVVDSNKIEVLFRDDFRTLIHKK